MTAGVLVTAVGGDIGRDVVRCLKEDPGAVRVTGIDMDPFAPGSGIVDDFEVVPPVREQDQYLQAVLSVAQRNGVDTIIPISEPEIRFFDSHRESFSKFRLMMLDSRILTVSLDKWKTVQWLQENGLPHPATFLRKDFHNQIPFPVLLKERQTCGSHSIAIARSESELQVYAARMSDAVVQEIVGSAEHEYTVGVFSDGTDIRQIQYRRTLGFGGLSRRAETVDDPALSNLIRAMSEKLRLYGAMNVQLRKTSRGFVPFEINPRFSSTVYLRHRMGFHDVSWWNSLIHGRSSGYVPSGKKMLAVRVVGEVFYEL